MALRNGSLQSYDDVTALLLTKKLIGYVFSVYLGVVLFELCGFSNVNCFLGKLTRLLLYKE